MLLPAVSHETEPSSAPATDFSLVARYEQQPGRRAMYEVGVPFYNREVDTLVTCVYRYDL